MNKIYILIVLLLSFLKSSAQCGSDSLWDWTNTDASNWTAYYNQASNLIRVPWINPTGGLVGIESNKDYTGKEGWMLFRKDFGCPAAPYVVYPYFVLYNKYRSLLRVFVYNTSGEKVSGVTIRISHNTSYYSGLLSNTRSTFLAADQYSSFSSLESNAGDEMGMTKTEEVQQNGWLYADFPIAFDPQLSGRFVNLDIHVDGNLDAHISLTGGIDVGNVSTGNVGINSSKSSKTNCTFCNASKFSADAAKFMEKIPSYESFKTKLEKIAKKIPEKQDTTSILNITRKNILAFSKNSAIKTILQLAGGGGEALSILSSVFSFVSATLLGESPATTAFVPTVMHGSVGLTGSIETNLPMMSFTTQPPGSSHSSSNQNLPYFDCPMGLLTVSNTPKVFVKRWLPFSYVKAKDPIRSDHCPILIEYPHFYSYQIQDNIEVKLNGANDDILRLVSLDACLEARVKNQNVLSYNSNYSSSQNKTWDMFDLEKFSGDSINVICTYLDNSGSLPVFRHDTNSYVIYEKSSGYFRNVFTEGRYILEGPAVNGDDAGNNNYYLVRTPFRNISCLKNTSMTLPEGSELTGIKVRAVFERLDGSGKPVIYIATYKTDIQNKAEDNTPYPFAPNQITRETLDFGTGPLFSFSAAQATSTIISANHLFPGFFGMSSFSYQAGRGIELNPGFDSGRNDFEALIIDYGCAADVISTVPSPCKFRPSPIQRKGRTLAETDPEEIPATGDFAAYPNPFSESVQFRFSIENAGPVSVYVYNQLMQVTRVLQDVQYPEGEHTLSYETKDLPAGIYFAVLKAGDYSATRKLIRH